MRAPWTLLLASLLISCLGEPPPLTPRPGPRRTNTEPLPADVMRALFRAEGERIVTSSGAPVQLRGVAFGNEVWDHTALPSGHHDGRDYERVRNMGMNSVRFYLSYKTFEDDDAPGEYKKDGWDWIDQNIEWAKKYKVRLILNMHNPVGGFQSNGEGSALWESPDLQDRFVNLWHAIAERYRAEPVIVGYDLLNEPAPNKSKKQWQELAQRTIDDIRLVDQHHIVFVERVNAVNGDWSEDEDLNFVRVDDDNVVYEFHFYKPFHFTHQNAAWSQFVAREGWYPDEHVPEVDWYQLETKGSAESSKLPAGDSAWTMLETEPFVVVDEGLIVGKPFLVCDSADTGSAIFDSLSLTKVEHQEEPADEPAPASKKSKAPAVVIEPPEVHTLFEIDLDTRRGWYFYNPAGKGRADFVPQGHGDHTAISVAHTAGPAHLGSDPLRFFLEPGFEYQLLGLARGAGLGEKAKCGLRLEFYSSKVPVLPRGKEFLESALGAYLAWGEREKVPLYLGEFGTIRDSFLPGRGGVKWVEDMLSLLQENEVNFAYHAYHERPFGLFIGDQGLPSVYSANLPLYETLVRALLGPDAKAQLVPLEPEISGDETPKKEPKSTEPKPEPTDEETTPENFHDFD